MWKKGGGSRVGLKAGLNCKSWPSKPWTEPLGSAEACAGQSELSHTEPNDQLSSTTLGPGGFQQLEAVYPHRGNKSLCEGGALGVHLCGHCIRPLQQAVPLMQPRVVDEVSSGVVISQHCRPALYTGRAERPGAGQAWAVAKSLSTWRQGLSTEGRPPPPLLFIYS